MQNKISKSKFSFNSKEINIIGLKSWKQNQSLSKKIPSALVERMLSKTPKKGLEKAAVLKFPLTEGGVLILAILNNPKTSIQSWHTQLKDGLLAAFKDKDLSNVQCDLNELGAEWEEISLDLIGSLSVLSQWKYPKQTQEKDEDKAKSFHIKVDSKKSPAEITKIFQKGECLGENAALVRTLSHTPPNFLTPELYLNKIQKIAKDNGLNCSFINEKELTKKGAGAFLAVARASANRDAGIVKLSYKGPKANKKITFVGKGICFDTGGYNVKPGNYMLGMHQDMTGSAVALAMISIAAHLKLPYDFEAYLALAENHISPNGFKMNDVVYASNGKSIEVIHTDAEGRMVLSDTLSMATESKPDYVFDYATLTGSCIRAIGTGRAGIFSNQESQLALAFKAAEKSGEAVWTFPIGAEYEERLKSKVADLRQCDDAPNADQIIAATFLNHFVAKESLWFHMDLSTCDHKGGLGWLPEESSAFGLRWTLAMIELLEKNKK